MQPLVKLGVTDRFVSLWIAIHSRHNLAFITGIFSQDYLQKTSGLALGWLNQVNDITMRYNGATGLNLTKKATQRSYQVISEK